MKHEDEIRRAAEAEALLDNKVLKAAFDNTESQLLAQMRSAGFHDEKKHHHLVLALQVLGAIRRNIEVTIETGQMAKLELDNKGKLSRLFG